MNLRSLQLAFYAAIFSRRFIRFRYYWSAVVCTPIIFLAMWEDTKHLEAEDDFEENFALDFQRTQILKSASLTTEDWQLYQQYRRDHYRR